MKTLLVVLLWSAVAFAQAESPPPPPPPPPASSPSEGEAPPAPPPPEANAEAKTPKKYWARGAAYAGFVMAGLAIIGGVVADVGYAVQMNSSGVRQEGNFGISGASLG